MTNKLVNISHSLFKKIKHSDDQDVMVIAHEFAKEKLLRSEKVTITKFEEHMQECGFKDEELNKKIFGHIFLPSFINGPTFDRFYKEGHSKSGDYEFDMLPNAYFALVELKELQDARKSAKQAKKRSDIAILISLFAIIISVIVGFKTQEVKIQDEQIDKIISEVQNSEDK